MYARIIQYYRPTYIELRFWKLFQLLLLILIIADALIPNSKDLWAAIIDHWSFPFLSNINPATGYISLTCSHSRKGDLCTLTESSASQVPTCSMTVP